MQYDTRLTTYKQPWAQRFNLPKPSEVTRKTDAVVVPVAGSVRSAPDISRVVNMLNGDEHLDIIGTEMILVPDLSGAFKAANPDFFMRDSKPLYIPHRTMEELLVDGDPHKMVRAAYLKFQDPKTRFEPLVGWGYMPYNMKGGRHVVALTELVEGYRVAAALVHDCIDVRMYNARRGEPAAHIPEPVVEVPSRRKEDQVYKVLFRNFPSDPKTAYAQWTIMQADEVSDKRQHADRGQRTLMGEEYATFAMIAAGLLIGVQERVDVRKHGRTKVVAMETPYVLPWPTPSMETYEFDQTLRERVFIRETRESRAHRHLNRAEREVLHLANMKSIGPDRFFDFDEGGRFDPEKTLMRLDRIVDFYDRRN